MRLAITCPSSPGFSARRWLLLSRVETGPINCHVQGSNNDAHRFHADNFVTQ